MHGKGKLVAASGNIHDGNWANDMREGHGIQTCPDRSIYEGTWSQNKKNGNFNYCSGPGAKVYAQVWRNDK